MAQTKIEIHCKYIVPKEKFGNKDMGAIVEVTIDSDNPKDIVEKYKIIYEEMDKEIQEQRRIEKGILSLKERKKRGK